ncbi:MAG TPA: asparagine synthase-related protein [Rhizomicrobium sp.]
MSGICGILRFDGAAVAARDLERQMNAMGHLGPDRRRAWHDGPVGLAHLLMRVTQEDRFDAQPLRDEAGALTLVADLRLDNREELAKALGIDTETLRDMADSALLLRAYARWGEDCVDRLLGDFAFAIWDARAGKLVLARDHMGQRRIAFHRAEGFFAFATEIKGLWALGDVPRVLLDDMLGSAKLLNRNVEIAVTPFDGISAISGGTVMTVAADGATSVRRYWQPRADPRHQGQDEAYYVAAYRRVLGEAVACRLRRTTQPGALFFGGGFDSTAIAALAGPIVAAQNRKLICICSAMPQDYRGTIRHARRWAEICSRFMPHLDVRYVTGAGRSIFTAMEKSFFGGEGPTSAGGYITDDIHATAAAAGAKVIMDGHGGDYTLNPRNHPWLYSLLRQGRLREFVSEFRAYRRHSGAGVWRIAWAEVVANLLPQQINRVRMRHRHGLALFGSTWPLVKVQASAGIEARASKPVSGAQRRARMTRALESHQNGRALAGSRIPAACGLEFTQPFHDKRVIELALAIPEDLWVKGGRERYLARQALKDLYPPEYQTRGRGNDDLKPDFLAMAKSIEPQILAEIDRMEGDGKLSHRFDFPRMRKMLTRRRADDHNSGSEYDTRQAVVYFIQARYIEWFRRGNR